MNKHPKKPLIFDSNFPGICFPFNFDFSKRRPSNHNFLVSWSPTISSKTTVTKKRGFKTSQHFDRLCDLERPCNYWSTSPGQDLWSSPCYFPLDSSYVHPLIKKKNIHFFYSHKSAKQNSQQPFHIHKDANDYTASHYRLQTLPENTSFPTTRKLLIETQVPSEV
jgi:hypothetical protein